MNSVIIKLGMICLGYFVLIGVIAPFLISYKGDIEFIGGVLLLLLTISTIPTSIKYIIKLVKGEK